MSKRNKLVGISLMFIFFLPSIVKADQWEELYVGKSGETASKVELRRRSFKKRLKRGETIVYAHLRMNHKQGNKNTEATADYEVHCASRKVYRENLDMQTENVDRVRNTVRVPKKQGLEGQELQDFVGLMDILCSRDS